MHFPIGKNRKHVSIAGEQACGNLSGGKSKMWIALILSAAVTYLDTSCKISNVDDWYVNGWYLQIGLDLSRDIHFARERARPRMGHHYGSVPIHLRRLSFDWPKYWNVRLMNNDVPNDTGRHISTRAAHTSARIDSVGKPTSTFDEVDRTTRIRVPKSFLYVLPRPIEL